MEINVQVFGMLTEKLGRSTWTQHISAVQTDELINELQSQYPALNEVKCMWALNQQMLVGAQPVRPGDHLAIFPPFSGG
jgi:molybdopterin converting factor small subunit